MHLRVSRIVLEDEVAFDKTTKTIEMLRQHVEGICDRFGDSTAYQNEVGCSWDFSVASSTASFAI